MNSYVGTLRYLYGLQHRGMKFGLRNIRSLLKLVGNPEERFPSIHVAGTNGKGSTAAFLASIAMEAGYRTALYTSPHLLRFTERIRIDGTEMSEKRLVRYVQALRPGIERVRATFFEATTCIAFQYFADQEVDIAVIEAGLGGRLDSTNVLTPIVSVITNIGLDHTDILGKTISSIAREKGGIVKPGVPCVTSAEDPTALEILNKIATDRHSRLLQARRLARYATRDDDPSRVNFSSRSFFVGNANVGFEGPHQLDNARLAIATLEAIKGRRDRNAIIRCINNATIRRGLSNVVRNSGLRGRFETFGHSRRYILDVAHNPPGVHALVDVLGSHGYGDMTVVFGVMKDKDYPAMLDYLSTISRSIIAVAPSIQRALSARTLYRHMSRKGIPAVYGGPVAKGLKVAQKLGRPVLITGSHYVVGEALKFLSGEKT